MGKLDIESIIAKIYFELRSLVLHIQLVILSICVVGNSILLIRLSENIHCDLIAVNSGTVV